MANEIVTARKGPVLEITLNRPEIGNAASDAMAVELTRLLLGAGDSSEIRDRKALGADGWRSQYYQGQHNEYGRMTLMHF